MNLSCVVFMHFVMAPAFALWHSDVMLADLEFLRKLGSSLSDFGVSPRPLGNVVSDVSQTAAGIRMETQAASLSQDRSGTLQGLFHPNSKANPGEGSGLLERATCVQTGKGQWWLSLEKTQLTSGAASAGNKRGLSFQLDTFVLKHSDDSEDPR